MYDIIFCSLPFHDVDHIYAAPAILKGVAVQNGYSARTIDFGGVLFEHCDYNVELFYSVQNYFLMPEDLSNPEYQQIIDNFFDYVVNFFSDNPSKFIGISVLSIHSQKCTFVLCEKLRNKGLPAKIILGGPGLLPSIFSILYEKFNITNREKLLKFGDIIEHRKLADKVVYGDGEDAILSILADETHTAPQETSDMFYYPISDYKDYDVRHYVFHGGEFEMPITGSKGCVRSCDFCDVARQFGKYRYRSGNDVANEMIQLSKIYGIRKFRFTDSLINGGYKPFMEFLRKVSEYNLTNPEQRIIWSGQYICREPKEIPKGMYELIRDAGGEGLTIGAESGSNHVLEAMNKKTSVEALYAELENFRRVGVTCMLLTFVGHWSEGPEHFIEHCRMFLRLMPYVRSGTISAISLGDPFMLIDGIAANDVPGIRRSLFNNELVWYYPENPTNTLKERIFRQLILHKLLHKLDVPQIRKSLNLKLMAEALKEHVDEINKFHQQFGAIPTSSSKDYYSNFDSFFNDLVQSIETELTVELEVTASECDGIPKLVVEANNEILFSDYLTEGTHKLGLKYNVLGPTVDLKLSSAGWTRNSTKVNGQGEIIANKSIVINDFKINNFDIIKDYDFFNKIFKYSNSESPKMGFWGDETLSAELHLPFIPWYNSVSEKNVKIFGTLEIQARDLAQEEEERKVLQLLDRLEM